MVGIKSWCNEFERPSHSVPKRVNPGNVEHSQQGRIRSSSSSRGAGVSYNTLCETTVNERPSQPATNIFVLWICSDIVGMVTLGHIMSMIMKKKLQTTDPVSKALYKQFKTVSIIESYKPHNTKTNIGCIFSSLLNSYSK